MPDPEPPSAPPPAPVEDLARRLAESEANHDRAIAALRETEAAYRRLFEFNPLPMWVRDVESLRFVAVNRAALGTYGYSREEFLAMRVADILSPEEAPRFGVYLQERPDFDAEDDNARSGRWRHRRKDGAEITVEIWSHGLLFDGRPSRLVIARDITGQLRAEDELRFSRERFRLIAAATSDAIWDWDFAANTLWWSDSFFTLFGYQRNEFGGRISAWSDAIHPADRDRVVKSLEQARDQGREFWREEYRFRRSDGTYATVVDRGRVVRDQNGAPHRMVGGMTDITEQSRLQAQFLRAQRLESIGTLAGGIAHDLNNLLAPILLSIDLLRLQHPAPEAAKILSSIETSAQRGAELVRQVLGFARGVEGRRQPIQVRHLINEAALFAGETFPRSLAIHTEIAPDLWTISADSTQLNQVLLNLALNARDAMPDGGALGFAAANLELDPTRAAAIPQAKAGAYVAISISDTGQGIAPEHLDRVFEPFFTTKEVGKGTGLGLSIIHAIVREHNGFITVQSTPGQGSVFCVHLPADPNLEPTDTPPAAAPARRGKGQTILVIDDEAAIRDLTSRTLEIHGYQVLSAGDGAEGVALFAQHRDRVALVITDLAMPIMDGPATISALRRIQPRLPIVVASGHDPSRRIGQVAGLQVQGVLTKPYSTETLLSVLANCLHNRT